MRPLQTYHVLNNLIKIAITSESLSAINTDWQYRLTLSHKTVTLPHNFEQWTLLRRINHKKLRLLFMVSHLENNERSMCISFHTTIILSLYAYVFEMRTQKFMLWIPDLFSFTKFLLLKITTRDRDTAHKFVFSSVSLRSYR